MNQLNDDKKTVDEGRKKLLSKDQKVPLKEQQVKRLFQFCKEENVGAKVVSLWDKANSDRSEWLDRQSDFLSTYDEFIDVPAAGYFENSANLRVPMTLWILKAYHARFFQSIFSPEPSVSLKARKPQFQDAAMEFEEFLKYSLVEWANRNQGCEEAADQWVWSWCASGLGYLKDRWECVYRRYLDVESVEVIEPGEKPTDFPRITIEEKEVVKVEKVFDGPSVEFIPIEDIVVVGPDMSDIDAADAVIHRKFQTASDLHTLSERGLFDEEAVKTVIRSGNDSGFGDITSLLKDKRAENSGIYNTGGDNEKSRYEILEAYLAIDVDGTGIDSEIIVWVHKKSKTVLRATYLDRVSKLGERPFSSAFFHKRGGMNDKYPIGLVEMLYPIQKEVDAMHNMRMDFGMISTCPFGFYRASSSLEPKKLKVGPGDLIPLDDPQRDVYFPQLGVRTTFGATEEQILMTYAERLTGISDLTLGAISGKQGATRTASGVQAILGENNLNLNILLKRLNRGWKRFLKHQTANLQKNSPEGMEYRVTGELGVSQYRRVRPEFRDIFLDVEVSPNTEASNKQIQINNALQLVNLTANPLDIQLGIITAQNRYEALKAYLKTIGVKDVSKYINQQFANTVQLAPKQIIDMTLAGQELPLNPADDHEGVINLIQSMFNDDSLMGQLSPEQVLILQSKLQQHSQMQIALQAAQANQAASNQMRTNAQNSLAQTNPGGNMAEMAPTGMEM
jgi:hypothetical protein